MSLLQVNGVFRPLRVNNQLSSFLVDMRRLDVSNNAPRQGDEEVEVAIEILPFLQVFT